MKINLLLAALMALAFHSPAQTRAVDSLLVVSLRHQFSDSRKLSREPQIRWVSFDPKTSMETSDTIDETALAVLVKDKNVLILIHGMGVPFTRVMSNYRRLLQPPLPYDRVIGVTWPAQELRRSSFHNGMVFLNANTRAKKVGKRLTDLLEMMTKEAGSLDVFTHSLGAKVAVNALKRLSDEEIGNLFLTAPAIGSGSFQPHHRYRFISDKVREQIVVFFSQEDPVFRGLGRHKMGHRGAMEKNPKTGEKIRNVDCTPTIHAHSAYWQAPEVWDALSRRAGTDGREKP